MRRPFAIAFVAAAAVASACGSVAEDPPGPSPTTISTAAPTTTQLQPATPPSSTVAVNPVPVTATRPAPWLLTWVSGRLPAGFGASVSSIAGVERVTIVSAGIGDLISSHDASGRVIDTAPDGFAFPLEVFAVDRTTYAAFLPDAEAEVVSDLGFLRVVLSESSARVRRLGEGGSLTFRTPQGRLLTATVEAVLPDTMLGAAEVLTVDGDLLARDRLTPRYALVQGSLSPEALRSGLEAALGIHTPLQVLTVGDTPLARHADSVRPQSHIKLEFGEFAYREGRGRGIEIDPVWEAAHIVETDLPLLGRVKCHRQFAEVLGGVLGALEDAGAGDAIDARSFLGCWNPRWITDRRGLSRHAWGVAADINFGNTLDGGQGSPVHPALLTAMSDAGITSGHEWVQPDPGHFEWVGDGWS